MKEMTDWDATIGVWRAKACEWIFDIDTPQQRECGKDVQPGTSYCPECRKLAYQTYVPRKRKATS